jgi:hypothetical protein
MLDRNIREYISFVKTVPGFSTLTLNDQIRLLKSMGYILKKKKKRKIRELKIYKMYSRVKGYRCHKNEINVLLVCPKLCVLGLWLEIDYSLPSCTLVSDSLTDSKRIHTIARFSLTFFFFMCRSSLWGGSDLPDVWLQRWTQSADSTIRPLLLHPRDEQAGRRRTHSSTSSVPGDSSETESGLQGTDPLSVCRPLHARWVAFKTEDFFFFWSVNIQMGETESVTQWKGPKCGFAISL